MYIYFNLCMLIQACASPHKDLVIIQHFVRPFTPIAYSSTHTHTHTHIYIYMLSFQSTLVSLLINANGEVSSRHSLHISTVTNSIQWLDCSVLGFSGEKDHLPPWLKRIWYYYWRQTVWNRDEREVAQHAMYPNIPIQ